MAKSRACGPTPPVAKLDLRSRRRLAPNVLAADLSIFCFPFHQIRNCDTVLGAKHWRPSNPTIDAAVFAKTRFGNTTGHLGILGTACFTFPYLPYPNAFSRMSCNPHLRLLQLVGAVGAELGDMLHNSQQILIFTHMHFETWS